MIRAELEILVGRERRRETDPIARTRLGFFQLPFFQIYRRETDAKNVAIDIGGLQAKSRATYFAKVDIAR